MLKKEIGEVLKTTKRHLTTLNELGIKNLSDFLNYFPRTYEDQTNIYKIPEIKLNEKISVSGILKNLKAMRTRNQKFLISATLNDDFFSINIVWFNQPYILRVLKNGDKVVLTGKITYSYGKYSMTSPSFELVKNEQIHTGRLVPIYHETDCISSKWIREKLYPFIKWIDEFEDYLPEFILKNFKLIAYNKAIKEVHFPSNNILLDKAKRRLSFDELFLIQLKLLKKRWEYRGEVSGPKINVDNEIYNNFLKNLPFKLTKAQNNSLNEIFLDFGKKFPMMRLLQGDVGSGKTIVAIIAALMVLKSGYQTAVMAPTEILAKQHYKVFFNLLKSYKFNLKFLSGSLSQKEKDEIALNIKNGIIDLIIGTHAIIQENVCFKNLGLAVIDEQHRFGVKQRKRLQSFGTPHVLNMSATPIPRTMAMTLYGDLDLSVIDELPPNRRKVTTRIVPEKKRNDAYRWVDNNIEKGRQVFIICPLIDESEVLQVKSAVLEYERLSTYVFLNRKLALLHGKMKQSEKDEIMRLFNEGKIDILVSTSVVEVGIDIPNANVIIIEGAERFGLSQLHQFRGRVCRGNFESYCFLFTNSNTPECITRLNHLVNNDDGFKLSEIDLELRGPGEVYGYKQSGIPDLKMASYGDVNLMNEARNAAIQIIKIDPTIDKFPKLKQRILDLSN